MRKLGLLALSVFLVVLLVGCLEDQPTTEKIESQQLLSGWHLTVDCQNKRFREYAIKLGTRHGASLDGKGDNITISLYCDDGSCVGCIWVDVGGMEAIYGLTDGEFENINKARRDWDMRKIRDTLAGWINENYGNNK